MNNFFWKYFWNWGVTGAAPATQEVNASEQLINPILPANQGTVVNSQSGATYTVTEADRGKILVLTNAGGAAVTLKNAATMTRATSFLAFVQNLGAGAATLTPAVGTIDGQANITLAQFKGAILSTDGTNWFTVRA